MLGLALLAGSIPGPAAAAPGKHRSRYQVVRGHDVAATPDEFDVMPVMQHWFGSKKPGRPEVVLVLVPGFFGGIGNFDYAGERLVERMPWAQVWVVERRNNLLEQRCAMEDAAAAGTFQKIQLAAAYYLSGVQLIGCPRADDDPNDNEWNGLGSEQSLSQDEAASVGMNEWGLETELEDIRRVVALAQRRYPRAKVVLGGHSLGGMTTQLYAAWRFGKKRNTAGWKHLDGLVLIDGAVNGPGFHDTMVPQAFETRSLTDGGMSYWDDFAGGRTSLLGLLAEIGALAAIVAPDSESFIWTSLVGPLAWPADDTCPTNEAAFAALTDDQFGFSATFELHQGDLSDPLPDGAGGTLACKSPNEDRDLVGWVDFDDPSLDGQQEIASTSRWAHSMFDLAETNAVEWYFSTVLNADIDIASNLDSRGEYEHELVIRNAKQEFGHRVFDNTRVRVPVYGFISAFCRDNYDWYATVAEKVPSFRYVDRSAEHCDAPSDDPYGHVDPLFAEDEGGYSNDFFSTLSRWVRKKIR